MSFTPTSVGTKSGTLTIVSNDPDETPLNIPVTGMGLDEADIVIVDENEDLNVNFYPTLNDGAGNKLSEQIIILKRGLKISGGNKKNKLKPTIRPTLYLKTKTLMIDIHSDFSNLK